MIVIHIESGLGNQMLSYCEYLSLKYANPDQKFFLETIIYEIPECNNVICQWNGYELSRIFGINTPSNIKTLYKKREWDNIIQEIRNTEFWKNNWNYPVAFTSVLNKYGLSLINKRGVFLNAKHNSFITHKTTNLRSFFVDTRLGAFLKHWNNVIKEDKYIQLHNCSKDLFRKSEESFFDGQRLAFKYRGNNRHLIDDEIKKTFLFPDFTDKKNKEMAEFLVSVNSVAIHARRGDMLGANGWCYKYGYFRRAVRHIRKNVDKPIFVFFTDPGSITWCKENPNVFGLDYSQDKVFFVDWNQGIESYRDMQLMSYCKHAIITNSTFGWWGAYFIKNPNKITISPLVQIDTTYHC